MKKITLTKILSIIIIFLVGVIMGVILRMLTYKVECNNDYVDIYDIEPIVKEYASNKNSKIYLYNVNEIRINKDDNIMNLQDYLTLYKNNYDDVINSLDLEIVKTLKDGGTIIYKGKDNGNIVNKDVTVVKCNTDGNTDIYFGEYMNTTKAFQNGMCGKNFFSDYKFTRVYLIKSVKLLEELDNNKYKLELVINDNKKDVKIERIVDEDSKKIIKANQKYTFYFENKYKELIKEDIEDIFKNATLTGVVIYNEE